MAAWRIPDEVLAGAEDSPWVLPRHVFTGRTDEQIAHPGGASFTAAHSALVPPGSVLDIGAGAGAASLPLADRATEITAVDTDQQLLAEFRRRAEPRNVAARTVVGQWPDVADQVEPVDVVLCHHVVFNVAELGPFVEALTAHARRLVVVELTERHPLTALNPLWRHLHGIERPTGPTYADAVAVLAELGIHPDVVRWRRPPRAEHPDFTTLLDITRRRLCLPRSRTDDVAAALAELGYDRGTTPDLGSSGDDVVTVTWRP
ncbi:hypothetical protein GCM10012275_03260 [Longimycelium tulufanense]|uniref:Methyltransferase domain-containing protein n=1 Tax=Longimycelium tulufanense TaxID=907463 RepID=A0A8J3FTM4_9PSEU|nr:hypothetical protein GCM10012275_03260 [Longimycelium tulufanense]